MARIMTLGSLCIDHVYQVSDLAGPGQTVAASDYQVFPGGKGLNQSLAAARAGAAVSHAGCIGDDAEFLRELLVAAGINTDHLLTQSGPSGHAIIQVNDRGENAIVINGGANRTLQRAFIDAVLDDVTPEDYLLLQNEINDLPYILRGATSRGLRVAFNIAPPDERIHDYPLDAVTLFVLNGHEASSLARCDDASQAGRTLQQRYPNASLVITEGSAGLTFAADGHTPLTHIEAFVVDPVDETAAGDAFTGYLLAELVNGTPLAAALRTASAAGAVAVTTPGAASSIPPRAAVEALLATAASDA